jgi:DNA-binding XRE family transcriptional regulator
MVKTSMSTQVGGYFLFVHNVCVVLRILMMYNRKQAIGKGVRVVEIFERVQHLRKKVLKLTQDKFGDALGVSRDTIANIEQNRLVRPEQKEPLYKLICKTFNVSYEWLINGNGEMFVETQDEYFNSLAEQFGMGFYARKILDFYGSLDDKQKNSLQMFIREIAGLVMEENINEARVGIIEAITKANAPNNVVSDLLSKASNVLFEAFPYVDAGSVHRDSGNNADIDNAEAPSPSVVDKAIKRIEVYRAAESTTGKEHGVVSETQENIDKLYKGKRVVREEDF